MVSKRKRRRKLKKKIKYFLISLPIIIGVGVVLVYGFRIKSVGYVADKNQFTAFEVEQYVKNQKIENSLWFWFCSMIGNKKEFPMLENYSVTLNSPFKVTIHGEEKKLRSCVMFAENYFYLDESGVVLKQEPCAYVETKKHKKKILDNSMGIMDYTGLEIKDATLYKKLNTKSKEGLESVTRMTTAFDTMEIALEKAREQKLSFKELKVQEVAISNEYDITVHMKGGLKLALGKDNQLQEKMEDFVDIYVSSNEQLTKYKGTLQMQWISEDKNYTFIKDEVKKEEKKKKNDKKTE